MKKRFFSDLTLLAIAAIATTSCQDDITGGKHNTTYPENVIAFTIDGNKTLAGTRADVKHTIVAPSNVVDLPFEEGMPSLCLVETVTSLDDTYYDAVAGTRGTPVYTENFGDVYGGFYGRAYLMPQGTTTTGSTEGGSAPAYDDADLFLSPAWFAKEGEGIYVHDYSDLGLRWPSNHELYFFLETKRADEPVNNLKYNQDGSFSFDYTSPCPTPDQEDILFTSKVMKMESKDEENTLLFYHPLTGVKFKLGVLSEDNYGVKVDVTAIWMDGIAESGHCILKPNYVSGVNTSAGNKSNKKNDTNADTKSAACAKWTVDEDSRTLFYYEPDGTTVNGDEAAYKFADSFYTQTKDAFGTTADYNLNDNKYSKTFWFIPQTVTAEDDVNNVTIYYTVTFPDGSTADGVSDIALNTTWNAGELHTYTLAFRQVHVSIDDKVNGNVKSDLTTPNTGNVTEYQRVVLTANWVFHDEIYGEGDVIMEPYDLTTEEARSHFEGLLGGGMWVEGADGFFYYKNPIEPGKTPKVPLFTKFTAPEPTIKGTHLEMSISVQAVKFDTDKKIFDKYWENPVQKGTTSTKVSAWISTTPEK